MTTTAKTDAATELDRICVDTIRTLSMDAVQKANSGHPGTPMALAPIAYVLYTRVMRHAPSDPDWPNRDRFVLSAGHASMLLYSLLYLTGYGLELEDLKNFRQLGSPTAGHPEYRHAAGIEATTGPLGQGISTCTGLALGERMLNARLGDDVIDHHTFCIASDGDVQEGISSEGGSLAGHLKLGRLIAFYDDNHITIEGETPLAFSEDVGKRYEAYGWHVQNLGEDLALDRIEQAARTAMEVSDAPSLIICRTHIAYGSPNKQDTAAAHGSPLGEEEVKLTKQALGWPTEEPFYVPDEALAHFRECVERGAALGRGVGGAVGRHGADSSCRGLGRGPADVLAERRADDRDAQGGRRSAPMGGERRAPPGRRVSRPRSLDAPDHQGRGQRPGRRIRRAQPALRHPRAHDGRDRQRPPAAAASAPSARPS